MEDKVREDVVKAKVKYIMEVVKDVTDTLSDAEQWQVAVKLRTQLDTVKTRLEKKADKK